jgi:hypothetical protein
MTKIPVHVENEYWHSNGKPTGNIVVTPKVKVYSPKLKDYMHSLVYSPDSDYSVFPQEELESLVFRHVPFDCEMNFSDLFDSDCYVRD